MGKPGKLVAFYARVSTTGQSVQNQLAELRQAAQRHGWEVVGEFVDRGISGANGRDKRPRFDALLRGVARKEFNLVAAWSVDRLGRSLQHLVDFLAEIHAKGVDLYLHQQGIDTTTPGGKALFGMMGVFAEFERSMIRERVNAGLARARSQGKRLGRPRTVSNAVEARVRELRAQGVGILATARQAGCGVSTVQRLIREGAAPSATA